MTLIAIAAALGGALLTSLVGFAFGLVVLPALLLVGLPLPAAVFTVLLIGGATRVPDLWSGRRLLHGRRLALLVGACLIGSLPGFVIVSVVSQDVLRRFVGVLCIVAVGIQVVRGGGPRPTTATATAGALGGLLGPTVGLSGVPPSLLYARAHVSAEQTIAELSGYFVITNGVMLVGLAMVADGPPVDPLLTLVLLAAGLVGTAMGALLARRVSQRLFRMLTFAVALVSGAACLITT